MKKHLTSENIICFLAILFSVVITNNTLMFGTNSNIFFTTFATLLTCLFAILMIVYVLAFKKEWTRSRLLLVGILSVLILLSALFNADLRMGYIFKIALLFCGWAIVETVSFKKFVVFFDWLMTVLSAASLIATVLYLISPKLFSFLPIFQNVAGNQFYHFGVASIPTFYLGFPRNFGIFREPGVFQMYIVIAMLLQITVFQKTNYWKLALYTAAIITTLSTAGYLALGLLFILFWFRIKSLFSKKIKIVFFSSVGATILLLLLIPGVTETLYDLLFSKWNIHGASGASSVSRYASIVVNLLLAFRNPLFGAGITGTTDAFPLLTEEIFGYTANNTNTLFINFAMHGFLFGLIWLIGFFKGSCELGKKTSERIVIMLITIVLSMSQNYNYSLILYVLFFYCFISNGIQNKFFPFQSNRVFKNPIYPLINKIFISLKTKKED